MKIDNTERYKTLVATCKKVCKASGTNASILATAQNLWN